MPSWTMTGILRAEIHARRGSEEFVDPTAARVQVIGSSYEFRSRNHNPLTSRDD
jgi:hypothetical protein